MNGLKLHSPFFILSKMKKAQAGLSILLSVIVSIFLIGLLVMVYALMSGALIDTDALYSSRSGTIINETLTTVEDIAGENFSIVNYRSVVCTITQVINVTDQFVIPSANYTQTNCHIIWSTGMPSFNNTNWNVSYTYTYLQPTQAVGVMNGTTTSIAGTTTWFPIMIVITAMVVLILLTVIIITAIRGSGLMGQGGKGNNKRGGGNIGTA